MKLPPALLKLVRLTLIGLTLVAALVLIWAWRLDSEIKERIAGDWFVPPVEIYSAPARLQLGQTLSSAQFKTQLEQMGLRARESHQMVLENDFADFDREQCQSHLSEELEADVINCVTFRLGEGHGVAADLYLVGFNTEGQVLALYSGQPLAPRKALELQSTLFAQFYGGQPILRRVLQINEIPLDCLQAVTAIEDSDFLHHHGVSPTGLFRAFLKNLAHGRYAQGGSTITQQLVKVYFLTSKKTLKRKLTELLMAVLLETRVEKDKILQNYLNAIYMGQNGPFQVVGFGAASEHYFRRSLEELDLPQCALLAAMVNSPGRFNPFQNAENARQRRERVIQRMQELEMITPDKAEAALKSPLPSRPPRLLTEPAPYFVQAVERELEKKGIDPNQGLRIFTTLDIAAQEAAQVSVSQQLNQLEQGFKSLADRKAQGKELQASLISVEVATGEIMALVGGRSFKRTQYNRAIDGHRQVGSIMKPFVYLTALESRTKEGDPYTPLTLIEDASFTHKYEGQSWSPVNYDKEFWGTIPLMTGLKNSLNAATARLGIDVGLDAIVDVARRAGITSPIQPLPSMTLGSFELFPLEVASSYTTLARMGSKVNLSMIRRIETLSGNKLFEVTTEPEQSFARENVAVLIGMMKQTVLAGTARSLAPRGFTFPAAGKTGTTSDSKDAWFAGFTPDLLTVVWVGYDDNTPHGLTGASGALPIWSEYMKQIAPRWPRRDFTWPEGTVTFPYSVDEYNRKLSKPEELPITEFELVFREGEQPGF